MRILLVGEYSNVHWTLAQGLRKLGHKVTVVSDGDTWKDYPRDISLARKSTRPLDSLTYLIKVQTTHRRLRGYDVVQVINPVFLRLKPHRIWPYYQMLRRNNGSVFMGAFGMDKYWVRASMDCKTFRYSDFNMGDQVRVNDTNTQEYNEWMTGPKGVLNEQIAADCDGIIAGLYEYDASYRPYYADKMCFIPFPLDLDKYQARVRKASDGVVRFFIGIQRERSQYKGTDIMLRALNRAKADYPDRCVVTVAESLPFDEYVKALDGSHVLLDQLYSYTPAMNALQAMAQGLVVVGGGEEENYDILGEKELRPIVNVLPTEESVYSQLVELINHPERVETLSLQSIEYVRRHHSHVDVARKYLDFYEQKRRS